MDIDSLVALIFSFISPIILSGTGIRFLLTISAKAPIATSCQPLSSAVETSVTRFLPFIFDLYIAWSVSSSSSSRFFECSGYVPTPILAVICPTVSIGHASIEARILSAAIIAPAESIPGSNIQNSSPPSLAGISIERAFFFIISATVLIAISPKECPYISFIFFKKSKSRLITEKDCLKRCARSNSLLIDSLK